MPDREKIGLGSGLAVFFLGIGLLIFTFYIAYHVFTNPETLAGFKELAPNAGKNVENILKMVSYALAVGLLWVMGSIGGRITKNGYKMYSNRKKQ